MTRKAIIIGNNTGKDASTFLKGVTLDLTNYKNYLMSGAGGNWLYVDEIEILHNENKSAILKAIRECSSDYSFVVFTGHGFYNTKDSQTYICVDGDYIAENELHTSSSKQSLILDCCREKSSISESSYRNFTGGITKTRSIQPNLLTGKFSSDKLIEGKLHDAIKSQRVIYNSRGKFDNGIATCENGLFTGYACEIDQTSGDNPTNGGVFSSTLLLIGKEFASKNNDNVILRIKESVLETKTEIINDPFTSQIPTYKTDPSNMLKTGPFAVTNTFLE